MASYVETATLRVNDQSSKKIRSVDKALKSLFSTARASRGKVVGPKFDVSALTGIRKTTAAIHAMNKAAGARRSIVPPVKLGGVKRAQTEVAKLQSQIARLNGVGRVRGINRRFPGNIPAVTNRLLGVDAYYAARETVRTGARGVGARSSETLTQRTMGFSEGDIAKLNKLASDASAGMLTVNETAARAIARNLKMAGATADTLPALVKAQLEVQQATKSLLGEASAERFSERATKIVDLAGKMDEPQIAEKLIRALGQAQLVAGRDLNFNQVLTAMRNSSGLVMGMTPDAIRDFVSVVEEQGRKSADGLRSVDRVLNGTNVAEKNLAMLKASGLRVKGSAIDAGQFVRDPFKWIEENILTKAKAKGVNTGDLSDVRKFVTSLGFQQRGAAFVSSAILKTDERKRNRINAKRIKFDKLQMMASKDIVSASKMVREQFVDLSASALTPMVNAFASPLLVGIARRMDGLARGEFTATNIAAGVGAGAGAAGVFAASNASTIALTAAAFQLRGSSKLLNTASAALTRAAIADGASGAVVGGGSKNKKRTRRLKAGRGAAVLAVGAGALTVAEMVANGDKVGAKIALDALSKKTKKVAGEALNDLDVLDAAIKGTLPKIDGTKGSNKSRIPIPVSRPSPAMSKSVTTPTPRPNKPVPVSIASKDNFKSLPGMEGLEKQKAIKGVVSALLQALVLNERNIASVRRDGSLSSAQRSKELGRGFDVSNDLVSQIVNFEQATYEARTIAGTFSGSVDRAQASTQAMQSSVAAIGGAGAKLYEAILNGGSGAAAQIAAALNTPVNINVNQNNSGKSDTGTMAVGATP